jgi:hypothetical protein
MLLHLYQDCSEVIPVNVQDHLWHTGKRRQFLAPYSRFASIQWQPSMSIEWLCSYLLLSPLSFTVLVFDELALPWYSIASSKVVVAIMLTMLLESAFLLRLIWIWSWTSKPSSTQTALPGNHLPRAIMWCQMLLGGSGICSIHSEFPSFFFISIFLFTSLG